MRSQVVLYPAERCAFERAYTENRVPMVKPETMKGITKFVATIYSQRRLRRIAAIILILLFAASYTLPQRPKPPAATTLAATDTTWKIDGNSRAVLVDTGCLPSSWLSPQNLAPAKWIWAQPCVASDGETHTFSTSFSVTESGSKVELDIAVDNYAFVSVNGQRVERVDGFGKATTLDISKYVHPGSNQISIEAHNLTIGVSAGWDNPAGLLARLRVSGNGSTPPAVTGNACEDGTVRAVGKATSNSWTLPDPSGTIDIQITSPPSHGEYAVPGSENILTEIAKAFKLGAEAVPRGHIIKIPMRYFEELAKDGGEITQAGKRLSDKNRKMFVDLRITIPIIRRTVECCSAEVCKEGKWVPAGVKMIGNPVDKKGVAEKGPLPLLEGEVANTMNGFIGTTQRTLAAAQKAYDANPCQGVMAPVSVTPVRSIPKEDCDVFLKEIQDIRAEAVPPADEKITRAERNLREWMNARDDIRKRQFQEDMAAKKMLDDARIQLRTAKTRKQNLEANPNVPDERTWKTNLAQATTRITNEEADVKVKEKAYEEAHNRFLHNVDEETLKLEKLLSIAKADRAELDQKVARLQKEYDACTRRNQ